MPLMDTSGENDISNTGTIITWERVVNTRCEKKRNVALLSTAILMKHLSHN